MFTDVPSNLRHVCVIKSCINLVEDKKWTGLIAVNGKEQGQRSHGLLSTRQMLHVSESFQGRHGVIFDSVKIRLVRVFNIEVCLTTERVIRCARQVAIDWSDLVRDV